MQKESMKIHATHLTAEEISILTRYRMMTPDCKVCIDMLLDAAIGYQATGASVIDMIAGASKMR